jgi:hypothetical protein
VTVTLDATEVVVAQVLATMRYNVARMAGVTNARIGSQDDYQTDLEGMAAEIAFCKAFNYFPDLTVGPRKGGWDAKGRAGETIDIKVTKYNSGKLLATLKKKPEDAQYYVLLVGECPTYRLAGYATAEELLKPENITDLGHGKGYALTQDKLNQFSNNKGG